MKPDRKTYEINIAGLIRELPIVQITDNMAIASFVLLGDSQLVLKAAAELLPRPCRSFLGFSRWTAISSPERASSRTWCIRS